MLTSPYVKSLRRIEGFLGPYGFLSNFYKEPDGTFVEYEYQRAKCAQWKDRERFDTLLAKGILTPQQARAMGRRVELRPDWDDVKIGIMTFYVEKKFKDHDDLRIMLEATGDAYLEETNTWNDTFWGVCWGYGTNVLGEILMQVRAGIPSAEVDEL